MFVEGKLEKTDEQKEENRKYFHSAAQVNSCQHVGVFLPSGFWRKEIITKGRTRSISVKPDLVLSAGFLLFTR